jgi:hypothetical protein
MGCAELISLPEVRARKHWDTIRPWTPAER